MKADYQKLKEEIELDNDNTAISKDTIFLRNIELLILAFLMAF
jgi:hypothetical protein